MFALAKSVLLSGALLFLSFIVAQAAGADSQPIPVPKTVIYAGQNIDPHLLRDRIVPKTYINRVSVVTDYADVVGKVAKITLVPNRPIASNAVLEPFVVKVNARTMLKLKYGALSITAEVITLNAARAGEMVRARNVTTGVIVYGTAQMDGSLIAGDQL